MRELTSKKIRTIFILLCCVLLISNQNMVKTVKTSAAEVNVAFNKPVVLVNSYGTPIATSEIPLQYTGANLVDGNSSTFTQTRATMFGAIIHLGTQTLVSSLSVSNYSVNYLTKYDIKSSLDGTTWKILASNISIGASQTKNTILANAEKCRYIWISPTNYSTSSWFCLSEIAVYGVTNTEQVLSNNRLVTLVDSSGNAIPSEDIAFPGSNLVDGNKNNYAQTNNTFFGARIDLGSNSDVTGIEVTNYWANYITSFDIKASTNGLTWTTISANNTIGESESKMVVIPGECKSRYIWIAPLSFSSTTWRCFSEVTVYGRVIPPVYGYDDNNGRTLSVDGKDFIALGIDLNSFESLNGNLNYLKSQMDATIEMNGNFVGIPVCWKTIEPTMNTYNFDLIDSYIDYARSKGLKVSILWHGSNYASGNNSFVPDYIINDTITYTRNFGAGFANNYILCPSNKNTLNREKVAYNNLLDHIKNTDFDKTVLCAATSSEIDYLGGLLYPDQFLPPELDIRCECGLCNALYQNEGNVPFMEKQFSKYAKELFEYGAMTYNLPSYSAVCANSWFEGWRYAENPNVLKATVNNSNHIVVPSVANPDTIATFKNDMDLFTASQIPGNFVFVDGIDMGGHIDGKVECAPWISLLHYGGLGAIYWDAGTQNTDTSIVSNIAFRNKLRKYFAPIKGMQYYIAKMKSAPATNKFWWQDGQNTSNATTANFTFKQTNIFAKDYGVAFDIAPNECIFTGSTYGGSYTMEVTRTNGFSGYKFEKGYFDESTGNWIKFSNVAPVINGNKATFYVSSTDAGFYEKVVYRIYDDTPPAVNGVYDGYKGALRTIAFSEGVATLNGQKFISGTTVKATGRYNLIVTDNAGIDTKIDFSIVTIGDISCDGLIDISDLSLIKNHLLKKSNLTGLNLEAGQINLAEYITVKDLLSLKRHVLGIQIIDY